VLAGLFYRASRSLNLLAGLFFGRGNMALLCKYQALLKDVGMPRKGFFYVYRALFILMTKPENAGNA
jgi:hypothetical protein